MKIYVANWPGFSEAGRDFYCKRLLPLVREWGFEAPDPRDIGIGIPGPGAEKGRDRFSAPVGGRNGKAIESSDGVLVILDGTDVDSAAVSEIGCAFALGKKILGCRRVFVSRETTREVP